MQDDRGDMDAGQRLVEMPDGNLLLSFRNISTVIIGQAVRQGRSAGGWVPAADWAARAVLLANGHVLIFDNGAHRLDHPFPHSRVLEIDPATKEIVWRYQETRLADFFSPAYPTPSVSRTATR